MLNCMVYPTTVYTIPIKIVYKKDVFLKNLHFYVLVFILVPQTNSIFLILISFFTRPVSAPDLHGGHYNFAI